MRTVLTSPPHLPLVGASILSADFADLARDAQSALDAGADLLHVDVMDGQFVPNLTMGPALVASLRKALPDAAMDVHLMTSFPEQWFQPLADAGADHVTFHIEALEREGDPQQARDRALEFASEAREMGMTAGIAVNPPTPIDKVLPIAAEMDMTLIMSVNPGFSGQAFIEDVLAKVWTLRETLGKDARIQMDGGVAPSNASKVRAAGCDVLAAASAIFSAGNRTDAIASLRGE